MPKKFFPNDDGKLQNARATADAANPFLRSGAASFGLVQSVVNAFQGAVVVCL